MAKKKDDEIMKISVQEATELLLMSQSSVYSWIERGKFKTEDLPSGKVIVISGKEAEQIKEYNLKSRRNKVSKQSQQNIDNLQENNVIDAEFTGNYEENVTIPNDNPLNLAANGSLSKETLKLVELVSNLSAKAGKYELLEDMQKQREQDLEYWKNRYFELKTENDQLKAELEKLRSRSFFGLFSK